jgi:threonine/homoserine/homoserine lactone efflux protein
MEPHLFVQGLVIGFSIAAPVGPIGILCIRRALSDGPGIGLVTGLGAATADALYGCVAAFGLTSISAFLAGQQRWLGLVGGIFLCYLGIRTFLSEPPDPAAEANERGLISVYLSTLFLTLTNPSTILSFAAIFAGLGLGKARDFRAAASLVVGVFVGSAVWWLILSNGVAVIRQRVTSAWMQKINRVSGCFLFAFGIYALTKAAWG